jgi:hypothetical protein
MKKGGDGLYLFDRKDKDGIIEAGKGCEVQ